MPNYPVPYVPTQPGEYANKGYVDSIATVVNAASYGAVGDNTTDNTTAITNAIAAVGPKGILKFGPGIFRYTGNLAGVAGVRIEGSGRGNTILRNTHASNPGVKLYGTAGGPYLNGAVLANVTLDATAVNAGQVGLDVLLAQAFTVNNVEVKGYGVGLQHKASWENLYEDVHANACTIGYQFPAISPYTPSAPITFTSCHAIGCGTAINIVDGVQSMVWSGGDFSNTTTTIAVIDGANTGQISFIGVNFEQCPGDDVVLGPTAGPASITFEGCRFFYGGGTNKARSIWLQNGDGLNFIGCRWTGITKVLRQESTTGAATFTGCGGYGYTTFVDMNGTTSDVSPYLISSSANGVGGVGPGANEKANTLKTSQWLATQVLYGAGKTTVADSDFGTAPVEGALAGVYNTTDSSFRLAQRHFGAWVTLPSITDLALKAPLASPAFTGTPTGITKAHVGLPFADNTADIDKPVSTAQQAAITAAVNALVNGAPGALDQLNELAAALGNDANFAATVTNALALKANDSTVVHLTNSETVSNKRITPRSVFAAVSATPTFNTDNADIVFLTGLNVNITSMTTNQTGTPVGSGERLTIDIQDDGTARTLAWGTKFENGYWLLPSVTIANTRMRCEFSWNAGTTKWRLVNLTGHYMGLTVSSVDFGNPGATNTTLTTPSAGLLAIEGVNMATVAGPVNINVAFTFLAFAARFYTYFLVAGGLPTLPTAVGNTSNYTVVNTTAAAINIATTSSQTIAGSAAPYSLPAKSSVVIVSDNANWWIV